MRRYWLDKDSIVENTDGEKEFLIENDDYHHICGVCRREEGHKFEILTEDAVAYFVQIVHKTNKKALAKILETREVQPLATPHIELCVSLPRFKKMDEIIEKAVEIGVHKVHPFMSDYSFIRDESKLSTSKLRRWNKIVKSATQQCGRGELMDVAPVLHLNELLDNFNQDEASVGLFSYEGESNLSLKEALNGLSEKPAERIYIFVGSEGGFSESEVKLFTDNKLEPVTMGEQILRVETACLALASIIKYELVMQR